MNTSARDPLLKALKRPSAKRPNEANNAFTDFAALEFTFHMTPTVLLDEHTPNSPITAVSN